MRRRRRYSRDAWELHRERCRIEAEEPPAARRTVSPSDVLPLILKRLRLEDAAWIRKLESEWSDIVGPTVARHARPGRYADGRLAVYVDSAVWLSELRFVLGEMKAKLQARFGAERITSVLLQADPDRSARA